MFTAVMLTACSKIQTVFMGADQSKLEYSASFSFDCGSLWELWEFLSVIYRSSWHIKPYGV